MNLKMTAVHHYDRMCSSHLPIRRRLTMATSTISIPVDPEAAQAFANASPEQQRKLALLLSLRLRELTTGSVRPLNEIMDEIGAQAEARGLTPKILDDLLRDE
jgi:hypothetical protein